jgi:hypothetical protein
MDRSEETTNAKKTNFQDLIAKGLSSLMQMQCII